jgi:hypothetical protein
MNAYSTITTGALATRVRRRLARDGQLLRRCWPWSESLAELGEFYVLAAGTHEVVARHVEFDKHRRVYAVDAATE